MAMPPRNADGDVDCDDYDDDDDVVDDDDDDEAGGGVDDNPSPSSPPSFVDRRRREIAAYWTDLMRIEDIFDFGNSEFGKTMATFLDVDDGVLTMARRGIGGSSSAAAAAAAATPAARQQQQHQQQQEQEQQQQLPSSSVTTLANKTTPPFPAIHEHESETFPGTIVGPASDPSSPPPRAARESSGLISSLSLANTTIARGTPSGIADDDVSILSDGTGAFHGGDAVGAPSSSRCFADRRGCFGAPVVVGRHPVVDVVPAHYDDDAGAAAAALAPVGEAGDATPPSIWSEERHQRPLSTSVAIPCANNSERSRDGSGRRGTGALPPRAKPAFQRHFM
jgi:hypothetical protein